MSSTRIAQLIADLHSKYAPQRRTAAEELITHGEAVVPELLQVLDLDEQHNRPAQVAAIYALTRIDTPEARTAAENWQRAQAKRQTQEARTVGAGNAKIR